MSVSDSVLVTGGAGYIGSHVVHALRDRGQRAVVIDDLSFGHREVVPEDVPLIVGDIGDRALLDRVFESCRIDAVVHLAGAILVAESVVDPLKYYQRNTAAAATLLQACVAHGVSRFVFSSTAAVYGAPETVPIPETAPLAPINPYGRSKLAVEWMLEDAARATPLRYLALRYFNVAGADAELRTGEWRPQASHLINVACEAALGYRDGMTVNGTDFPTRDGTCVRDYVHVADLADAHLAALDHLDAGGDSTAVNCGDGRGTTVREVVETVKRLSGTDFRADDAPRRPGDPPALVADPSRAHGLLRWRARRSLDEMIASALAWERKRRGMAGG
jgi:UDP-glucose 4-epimerase